MSELEHCRLAYEGKLDLLKHKLEEKNELATKKDQTNRSCVHWACAGGHENILDYLVIQFNAKIDESDDQGWTPLMSASSAGHLIIVKKLIAHKCDVNASNDNGQTSLHYAASKNHYEIAQVLLKNGAHVNSSDKYGHTPLHRAASKGFIKMVNLLVSEFKANVNSIDSLGNTPLHLACEEVRIEVAKILLKYGANSNAKNKEEKTPIDVSCGGLKNILDLNNF